MKTLSDLLEEWDTPDVDKSHKKLTKQFKYDAEDRAVIKRHTHGSGVLNGVLKLKAGMSTSDDEYHQKASTYPEVHKLISDLHNVTTKHTTTEDMHVYSGTSFHPDRYKNDDNSSIKVHMPTFTSTSLDPTIGQAFSRPDKAHHGLETNDGKPDYYWRVSELPRHVLKIHVPAGSHGVYVGSMAAQKYRNEKEFLLPKDSKIHIDPTPTEIKSIGPFQHPVTHYVWHAKLVHDGVQPTRHANEES